MPLTDIGALKKDRKEGGWPGHERQVDRAEEGRG